MSISLSSASRRGSNSGSRRRALQYEPTWESLMRHQTPQWLRDGKFGIYTHWGIYSVPAFGGNATWDYVPPVV